MYGFGDTLPVEPQSAELLNQIAVDYIVSITDMAVDVAAIQGKTTADPNDFLKVFMDIDPEMHRRAKELTQSLLELQQVRHINLDHFAEGSKRRR